MRRRASLALLVCAVAAIALACSNDSQAEPQSVQQQAVAQTAEPPQDDAAAAPARDDASQQQEAPTAANDDQQQSRPAMRSQQDSPQQPAPQQQDAYGGAAGPPAQIADPRQVIAKGFPLLPSVAAESDEFGWSAVIDGDTIAVGAPYHDEVAEDAGAVFIFERQGDGWVETARLLPPFGEAAGWFGRWLALDDGRLVIGAPYEDVTPATGGDAIHDVGSAYVYERINGEWRRTATLLPERMVPGASFGWSVAIDGDRLAVSAWNDTVDEEKAGSVYIYREAKGSWRLEARVVPPDPQPVHQFGRDIALDDNVLVVGAPGHDSDYEDSGAIYVYHQFEFAWNFTGRFIPPDLSVGDALGTQVSVSLPWFAAGAHAHDADGWEAGAVYLWRLGDVWEFNTRLVPSDIAVGDWFGYAPALQGDRLVVGAPHRADPDTGLYRTGAAYVFELVDGEWVELGVIGPVDSLTAGEKAEFGWAIDLNGDEIIVGSWLADAPAGVDAGAASAFVLESPTP